MRKQSKAFSSFILLVAAIPCLSVQIKTRFEPIQLEGTTMGTTYHITYFDSKKRNFKGPIDSLLVVVNKSISNYDPDSEVSRFNESKEGIDIELPYLLPPVEKSREIYQASLHAFDPTVMPLVNAWGFGPGRQILPDKAQVDSIKKFVGFDRISFSGNRLMKSDPRVQLDFGGIGQGYGADIIVDYLKSKGVSNMLVELGGEGMAIGKNLKTGSPWRVGILHPNSTLENQFFKAYVTLTDKSFTTSGNYFNYFEKDGRMYSHIIDPDTGFPAQRAILSASVFATDGITADAWATAFMVMGHERAIEILKKYPMIDVVLIYSNPDGELETFISSGIKPYVKLEP